MLASFGIGNMTQANSVAANVNGEWNVAEPVTGAVMVVLAAVVIVGGIKSLGRVTSFLVPVMIVVYILGAASVLALNIGESPAAFGVIFTDAFTGTAATGGFAGAAVAAAIRYGVARGIFSNESGLGTGGIAAAAAKTTHPARQALVSMTQTFIDTLVVVSFTALTIVVTGVCKDAGPDEAASFTARAFAQGLPGTWGSLIVTLAVMFFAFDPARMVLLRRAVHGVPVRAKSRVPLSDRVHRRGVSQPRRPAAPGRLGSRRGPRRMAGRRQALSV